MIAPEALCEGPDCDHLGPMAPVPSPSVRLFRGGELGRVAAALLALPAVALLAAGLGHAGGSDEPAAARPAPTSPTTVIPEPQLREEFLAAYEGWRRATWLVDYDFRRRLANGARLDLEVVELNRPPDHLIAGLGGLSGRVGGQLVVCDDVEGREVCAPRDPTVPFDEEVAAQLAELRDAVQPPAKWYAVEGGGTRAIAGERGRCFELRRIVNVPSPPYGNRAEYCFTADGIQLLARLERTEGTDERVAFDVRRIVTDADVEALLTGE